MESSHRYQSQLQRRRMLEEIDMMGNINDVFNVFNQLRQNPMQVLSTRFNIPQNMNMNDPNSIIQHLLNTGQITQQQVNGCMNMRNNPIIQQLMNRH